MITKKNVALQFSFNSYLKIGMAIDVNWHVVQCTMGRGGVVSKGHKGACYWVWYLCKKIVECLEKVPSCFRKWPEPCFLRPDLKIFLEFSKKNFFATCVTLNMTRQNYFFVKKVCKKSLPIKFVVDFFQIKRAQGWMQLSMKSM